MSVQGINSVVATQLADEKILKIKANEDTLNSVFTVESFLPEIDAKSLAQSLVDDICGWGTGNKTLYHFEKITKDNVIEVLENFKKITASQGKEQTLLQAIYSEAWVSRSTPKKYAQMIFRQLERKSEELGIDNKILKEKQVEELNKLSDNWQVNFGIADSSKVEFFVDEMIKRINIRNKLLVANSAKVNECNGQTAPAKAELKRVNGIIESYGLNTEDTLGNGKLDNVLQQVNPNCWAIAGLNSVCENDEIKEYMNSMLLKKDGVVSFYLAAADKVYSFTEKEVLDGANKAYVIGDGDATAVILSIDKYFKESGAKDYTDSRDGAITVGKIFELLFAKTPRNEKWTVDNIRPKEFVETKNISAIAFDMFVEKATKDEPLAGIFCFRNGVNAERISSTDALAEPKAIKLSYSHAYSFYTADENYVYFKDSNYADSYIRTTRDIAYHVLDAAIYRYR